jgi:carbon monoxide dehydrogenase subunit G
MRIQEEFTVPASPATVWAFFDDVPRVVRCVPGVQEVETLAPDRYRVVVTQKVGFISATFEVKTQLELKEPPRALEFASVGKTIRGALGNLRSRDRVDVAEEPGGGTRVRLTSEVALGGMLGSVGAKVMASVSREVTQQFARALREQIATASPGTPAPSG